MRSFKDIMSRVPLNERLRFLESMSFVNGKLVNVRLADLRGVLRQSDIEALMADCGCKQGYECNPYNGNCVANIDYACNPASCKPISPSGSAFVELGTLLLQTPPPVRQRFLDSLDFENGQLTGAEILLVEKHVDEKNHSNLPAVLHK